MYMCTDRNMLYIIYLWLPSLKFSFFNHYCLSHHLQLSMWNENMHFIFTFNNSKAKKKNYQKKIHIYNFIRKHYERSLSWKTHLPRNLQLFIFFSYVCNSPTCQNLWQVIIARLRSLHSFSMQFPTLTLRCLNFDGFFLWDILAGIFL